MVRRFRRWLVGLVLVAIAVGGAGWYWFYRQSDEAAIHRLLEQLAYSASRAEKEKTSTGLWKVHSVGELFLPETELEFRTEMFSGKYSPEEIKSNLQRFRQVMRESTVRYRDLELTLTPPDQATVVFTGQLIGRTRDGRRVDEVRNLVCSLRKSEGKWKVARISVRDILEK